MIPKVIHYCWFGGAPKPKSVLRCIESWKKNCPDFEIREWSEKDFDFSINEYTRQAYEMKVWGFVPDYIRLWIIYHHGGVYLDTDVQVIKDFTPLLQEKAFAGFEKGTGDKVNFGQGFGAEPYNPIIEKHMHFYDDMKFILPDGSLNKIASPVYTTEILVQQGLDVGKKQIQYLDNITIYPVEYFCPKDYETKRIKKTNNTYSIHHFDGSWITKEEWNEKKRYRRKAKIEKINNMRYEYMCKVLGKQRYEKIKYAVKRFVFFQND